MKKLQCEVCGSAEIRKVSDDLYVCQNCGLQYQAGDEKKLLVEIKDVLENIEEKIVSQQKEAKRAEEESVWKNCYIVEPKVDPKENVKHFVSYLDKTMNIACDIYKEISLEQTKEFFLPFYHIKGFYRVQWNAIACHTYYENETVYQNRWDSNQRKMVGVPTTERVQKIQRTPVNGSQDCKRIGFTPASKELEAEFSTASRKETDDLWHSFKKQQEEKCKTGREYVNFDISKLRQEGDRFFYGDWELRNQQDLNAAAKEKSAMRNGAELYVHGLARHSVNDGYLENYSGSSRILSEEIAVVYVPVQVITYRYKGQLYTAVSDLTSITGTLPTVYPCDTELTGKQEEVGEESVRVKKMSGLMKLGFVLAVVGLLAMLLMDKLGDSADSIWIGIGLMIASLILIITGLIMDAGKRKRFAEHEDLAILEVYAPRKLALQETKAAFMAAYPDTAEAMADAKCFAISAYTREVSDAFDIAYIEEQTLEADSLARIAQLEKEISSLQTKNLLVCIILMGVLCIFIIPIIVGMIISVKLNKELAQKTQELQELKEKWEQV